MLNIKHQFTSIKYFQIFILHSHFIETIPNNITKDDFNSLCGFILACFADERNLSFTVFLLKYE